jgi:hypothetical protein
MGDGMGFQPFTTEEALAAYRGDLEKLGLSEPLIGTLVDFMRPEIERVNRMLDNLTDLVPVSMSKEEIEAYVTATQGRYTTEDRGLA